MGDKITVMTLVKAVVDTETMQTEVSADLQADKPISRELTLAISANALRQTFIQVTGEAETEKVKGMTLE